MNEATEQLLRELAEKLGTTMENLWSVLVAQAAIEGWTALFAIIGLVVVTLALWAMYWKQKENEPFLVFPVVSSIALLILSVPLVNIILTAFLNPEYLALKEILKVLS